MYGVEAASGGGGLMAQAPGGNAYLPQALRIRSSASGQMGGPIVGGASVLPQSFGQTVSGMGPQISWTGSSVQNNPSQAMSSWKDVLDFHNSAAPYILIGLLIIYGWTHLSYRARGARELGLGRA